jgi:hypothetical protein
MVKDTLTISAEQIAQYSLLTGNDITVGASYVTVIGQKNLEVHDDEDLKKRPLDPTKANIVIWWGKDVPEEKRKVVDETVYALMKSNGLCP